MLKGLEYNENRPRIDVLLESDFTKEIRITFRKDQIMKEHQTPFPIVVQVIEGAIDFGVEGTVQHLDRGDMIALSGSVPHDLKAKEESVVRLTLSKPDSSDRVKTAAK